MDAPLAAFDNAVEKLLELSLVESLPEQLAQLRFLFEEEFDRLRLDRLWLEDALRGDDPAV